MEGERGSEGMRVRNIRRYFPSQALHVAVITKVIAANLKQIFRVYPSTLCLCVPKARISFRSVVLVSIVAVGGCKVRFRLLTCAFSMCNNSETVMSAHGHTTDDEMHELNYEADYLDQKSPKRVNGRHNREHSDPDAQAMVIESLRSQIQDLFSQVTQLNSKLVKSYDRVSDLEDELHVASANLRSSTLKVSNLELERTQHLSALSTGLLVEKDHVTTELTRLMEKATEEAARRGQAESARMAIEKDLDDLSAGLFDQANRMVAEARFGRAVSERKAEETEQALRSAEEVVGVLQAQMQALQSEKEQSERQMREMQAVMGKGKWVSRPSARSVQLRHLSSHLPYHEFLQFIAHLRSLHLSTPQVPSVTTLLPLPFLARLVSEDSCVSVTRLLGINIDAFVTGILPFALILHPL